MKKIVLLLVFLVSAGSYIAQTATERTKRIELKKTYEPVQVKLTAAEESPYYGYDNKIREILLKETSMELVPKRTQNQSKNDYLVTLNGWIKSNSLLIKPDKKGIEVN